MLQQCAIIENAIVALAVCHQFGVFFIGSLEQRARVFLVVGRNALLVSPCRVLRRRARGTYRKCVVAEGFLHLHIVKECTVIILLKIALAILETARHGVSPSAVQSTAGVPNRSSAESEAPEFLLDRSFSRRFNARGYDVDCAADGWKCEFGCAESSLNLHGLGHQIKAKPIVPEYRSAFHVVDGNAIYEDRDVSLFETSDGYRRTVIV